MDLKSTYNKIAADWTKDHAVDTWWVEGTEKFCSLLKPQSSVLDIGCGAGLKTNYLTDKGFRVIGIDFSENMINLARKKYPLLDFDVVNVYALDTYKKTFDALFAQAVLLHIPKAKVLRVLEKMKTKLNKGGFLYVAVKEPKEGQAEEEVKRENDYGYDYERFFSFFTMSELESYFKILDLKVIWESVTNSGRTNWLQIIVKKI